MADPKTIAEAPKPDNGPPAISDELRRELAELTNTQRAAVLMLNSGANSPS